MQSKIWKDDILDKLINLKNYERVRIGEPLRRRNGAYIYLIYDKDQFSKGIRSLITCLSGSTFNFS